MAIKAQNTITLYNAVSIKETKLYFKLVNAGSSVPAKPTTLTPSGWTTTEPSFDISKDLYATTETIFSDDSFLYSNVNKYSSYEAAKQAYNTATAAQTTANTANTTANNITNRVNDKENHFNFKYYTDVRVYGETNKFYPVIIKAGDQNVKRTIMVKRGYSESAPAEWNKSTHPGALTLKILCNFGGWGGATYSWEISEFQEQYSNIFGGATLCGNSCMFAIFLRGGGTNGAIYHLYSDQSLTANIYNYGWDSSINKYKANVLPAPQISYRTNYIQYKSDLCFGVPGNVTQNPAGSGYYDDLQYKADAPAPRDMVANGTTDGGFTKYVRTSSQNEEIRIRNYVSLTQNNDTRLNDTILKVNGKIESYYQSSDPSSSWSTNVEKETHIGDIWYNTSNQKTFVYYKNNTNPVTYEWKWQNVPTELIDSVNGKATIYSGVIPTNYKAGDYWIIPTNCFTNAVSIPAVGSQVGEYTVGMVLTLGPYTLTVDAVNSNNKITQYHTSVPATGNYSIAGTYSNEALTMTVTSVANFTLPNSCYGGSICIATANNTSYNASNWIPRNDYVPADMAGRYSLAEDVNTYIQTLNGTISTNYNDLNGKINNNYNTLDGKIDGNYDTLDGKITNNYNTLDGKVDGVDSRVTSLDNKYDDIINGPTGVKQSIQKLEDRLVANIRGTGGNNLLQNSVGFRQKLYWNEVIVSSITNIEQTYKTYAGQTVTIFFRYKTTDVNNVKITLGKYTGSTFTQLVELLNISTRQTDWIDFSYTYISSINNPVIRFNSTFTGVQDNDAESNGASGSKLVFANGLIITDLMIGYGEKQPWTPYYNEVYGKTYNLDQYGFDTREAASGKYAHLDANSLDFCNNIGTIESEFSKARTSTDNIYVANSINIGNLNIIKLDDNNIIEY